MTINDGGVPTTPMQEAEEAVEDFPKKYDVNDHHRLSSLQELSERVVTTATSSKKFNKRSATLSQLALDNVKLHGRDDHVKLLKRKLRDFTVKKDSTDESNKAEAHQSELLLVAGASG